MKKTYCRAQMFTIICFLVLISGFGGFPNAMAASESSLCAQVKIHIPQELTFERQGFNAILGIGNSTVGTTLENVAVSVEFFDENTNPVPVSEDPDDPDALFFIRVDELNNIGAIDGTGAVDPETSASVVWLIVPAPGAAQGSADGTLYYVGATLSYDIDGENHTIQVTPDQIYVNPTPVLTLDYFLPETVYGDDVTTPGIEAPTPFSLGLRVKNTGLATARNLAIASARPQIIENEQGLLVGFDIEGCRINGNEASPSLLANFGDLASGGIGTARWTMTCSLSGEFVEFSADFSHADDLGGELTSLVTGVNTYTLVHDVLVDRPGKDDILDFLARDDSEELQVFESSGIDTSATDVSDSASISPLPSGDQYRLTVPQTAGMIFASLDDPKAGQKIIARAIRSDGKIVSDHNAWLSKTRNALGPWEYSINLFDMDTTGSYTVVFGEPEQAANAPVLQHIPDKNGLIQQQLSFLVAATDADGTVPALTATPLPSGASFTDQQTGSGTLDWTPGASQTGHYGITFAASDGELTDSQFVAVNIYSNVDTDNDNLPDDYELEKFQTLDRDGSGDFDDDGILDNVEFANGTDPANHKPAAALSALPIQGFKPLEVEFLDGSSSADGIAKWMWQFGDGKTSTAQNPTFTYETGGVFDIALTVSEFDGDTDSTVVGNYIRVNSIRNVCLSGCEYDSIQTAIDESIGGDCVTVAPGQYDESVDFSGIDLSLENTDTPAQYAYPAKSPYPAAACLPTTRGRSHASSMIFRDFNGTVDFICKSKAKVFGLRIIPLHGISEFRSRFFGKFDFIYHICRRLLALAFPSL